MKRSTARNLSIGQVFRVWGFGLSRFVKVTETDFCREENLLAVLGALAVFPTRPDRSVYALDAFLALDRASMNAVGVWSSLIRSWDALRDPETRVFVPLPEVVDLVAGRADLGKVA